MEFRRKQRKLLIQFGCCRLRRVVLTLSLMFSFGNVHAGSPIEFNIGPQPLELALHAFIAQSNIDLLYLPEMVRGLKLKQDSDVIFDQLFIQYVKKSHRKMKTSCAIMKKRVTLQCCQVS